jgi:hypothetical protein
MKPIWLVIGIIAIVLGLAGAFALGAFAFPQRTFTPVAGAFAPRGMMGQGYGVTAPGSIMGPGMMGRGGAGFAPNINGGAGTFGFGPSNTQQNSLIEIAAKDLNLTVNDLITELQKNKSIADVAKERTSRPTRSWMTMSLLRKP